VVCGTGDAGVSGALKNEAQRSDESDFMQLLDAVHCMDNCKGMMMLPDECVDLVVTSPPYDDLRTYGGHSWDFYGVAWNLARVLKPGAVIVWNVADQTKDGSETGTSMRQALHFQSLGLNLHDTMIYQVAGTGAKGSNLAYWQEWEYCFVLSKGKPKAWNPIKTGKTTTTGGERRKNTGEVKQQRDRQENEGRPGNIWRYAVGQDSTGHPAPFPYKMAADHIVSWSNKGDIVLDPFMGSGTTAKAAQELGRHYIGFEINPEYVEICQRRTAQTTLGI